MRSIPAILSLLLTTLSSAAIAEWTPVGRGNDIYTPFVDKATIRPRGANVSMSGMYDFRKQDFTPEGKGLFSTVVLREYDCEGRQVRLLSAIDFSGHRGTGNAVSASADPRRWEPVVAGGIDDAYWKVACARMKR